MVNNAAAFDVLEGYGVGILFILHGKNSFGAGRHKINFAGGEVGDVGSASVAEAMTFLRFLSVEQKGQGIRISGDDVIDFHLVGLGEAQTQFLRFGADRVVIDGKTALHDNVIETVHGGAAEAVFLRVGGEGGGGGVVAGAENKVIRFVDLFDEVHLVPVNIDRGFGQFQVAAAGGFVGENFAARQSKLFQESVFMKGLVKHFIGFFLNRVACFFQEGEVLEFAGIVQVDQHAHSTTVNVVEDGGK